VISVSREFGFSTQTARSDGDSIHTRAKPMSAGPRLLSIKDVAVYLGARVWAMRQMLRKRELPYVPVGGRFKIDKVELDRWIERQKIGTGVPA